VVAGGTGLVGKALVEQLLATPAFDRVATLGRRKTGREHPKLTEYETDLLAPQVTEVPTDLFCCLGTTIKKAGSQAAFREVDHDMIVSFAKWGRDHGAIRFFLVSSVGAEPELIARAMIGAALRGDQGHHVCEYDDFVRLAG
jgi:uncharacterized protein YbjT (DUF2867 family)